MKILRASAFLLISNVASGPIRQCLDTKSPDFPPIQVHFTDIHKNDHLLSDSTRDFAIEFNYLPNARASDRTSEEAFDPASVIDTPLICLGKIKRACRPLKIKTNTNLRLPYKIRLVLPRLELKKSAVIKLKRCGKLIGQSPRFYLLPVSDQLPAVQEDRELFNNDADNHDDIQASPEFSPDDDNQSDDYYSVRSFFENDDTNDHYLIQESENHQLSGDLSADFLHGAFLLFEKVKRIPIRDFPKLRQYSRLYALYKQAAIGEAPTTSPPVYKAVEHAKWKLWKDMRGKITAIEAQLAFLEELDRLLPNWREDPMLNGYNDAIIFAEIDRGRKERAKLK